MSFVFFVDNCLRCKYHCIDSRYKEQILIYQISEQEDIMVEIAGRKWKWIGHVLRIGHVFMRMTSTEKPSNGQ